MGAPWTLRRPGRRPHQLGLLPLVAVLLRQQVADDLDEVLASTGGRPVSRGQGAPARTPPVTRARDRRATGAGPCATRGRTRAPSGLHRVGALSGTRSPWGALLGGPAGTHLHVPRGGAVVCPSKDLRHVPQDVDGRQQVAAVAGAVLGDLHQGLDDLRHPLPGQPALRLRQVLPGLARQGVWVP